MLDEAICMGAAMGLSAGTPPAVQVCSYSMLIAIGRIRQPVTFTY